MARQYLSLACVAFVACVVVAVASPSPPQFPLAYSATLEVTSSNGESGSLTAYWQRSSALNGTAYVSSQGTTIWNFGNGNNGNVYTIQGGRCQCYCPIMAQLQCNLEDSLCTYDYKHSAKYSGSGTVNGEQVNVFKWNEDLFGIPMNELTLSVDASTSAPVKQVRVVTPFGKYEGTENTTWTNFQIGNPPASVWQVPDEKYCQQCGNGACQNDVKAAELFYGWRVAKQDE